jgi:tetratricopeptide (TPR) repeat protein
VSLEPGQADSLNTLALAEYRSGHWAESLAACEKAIKLRKAAHACDWFFMAMALGQKGEKDKARPWFDKAVAWTREKDPKNKEFLQFWAEAAELLGQPGPGQPKASPEKQPH